MENNNSTHAGKAIEKLVEQCGSVTLMNNDNKKMLEKVKDQKTSEEAFKALLTDPESERSMSYAESRARFG
tara:strand:- start:1890 stop:2102 length:213 start_codon:yes stop_codon:yes gene_type:complete